MVALDGTKMRAVASLKNIAGAGRLARDLAHTEKQVKRLTVLADGGYSNAQATAEWERDSIGVAAPIKRGAMNTDFFRPNQFAYDTASDTIRCPAGQTLRPSGKHTRNRAIRYRTKACADCRLKPRCTAGVQRTIHRLVDQAALDRMEARIYANPSLMVTRRCTVEHPFGTIKRMSGGGPIPHPRPQSSKGGGGALDPGLQHPPCGERVRSGAPDTIGLKDQLKLDLSGESAPRVLAQPAPQCPTCDS
jgi:hypothetical protein